MTAPDSSEDLRSAGRRLGPLTFGIALVGCGVLVVFLVLTSAGRADAHAFAVTSNPSPGARLQVAPAEVSLEFTEPVGPGAQVRFRVLARTKEMPLRSVQQQGSSRRVVVAMPVDISGVYVIDWQVASADDGHVTTGELAFAVGNGGVIPTSSAGSGGSSPAGLLETTLVVLGVALALGSLCVTLWVDPSWPARSTTVRVALLGAVAGSAGGYLSAHASSTSRAGEAAAVAVVAFAVALVVLNVAGRAGPTLAFTVIGASAWAARSHLAVHGLGPFVLDAVHLVVAGAWFGSLLIVASRLLRRDGPARWEALHAYSRLAMGLVAILVGTGIAGTAIVLPEPGDLWRTDYGQLLLAKIILLVLALGFAARSQWQGLRPRNQQVIRHAVPVETALLAVIVVVAVVLANTGPPSPSRSIASIIGPPPIVGTSYRDAGRAGFLVVSLSAGDGRLDVQVLAPDDSTPDAKLSIEATPPGRPPETLQPRPCGPGCFTQRFQPATGTTHLNVSASAKGWRGGSFSTDLLWPVRVAAPSRLAALATTMRHVPMLTMTEAVISGPGAVSPPAPFQLSGRRFVATEPYASGLATQVTELPGGGLRAWYQQDNLWLTVQLDAQGRIRREHVINVGHQIERTFHYP
jgi:copper transport protein